MTDPGDLITGYLDGSLSSAQAAALCDWVKADPANARRFVREAIVHSSLRDLIVGEHALLGSDDAEPGPAGLGDAAILPAIREEEAGAAPESSGPAPPPWIPDRARAASRRKRPWRRAAVVLLPLILVAGLFRLLRPAGARATLAATADARWGAPYESLRPGQALPTDGPLSLTAGLAEVRFESGVSMILAAPARFRVSSASGAELEAGSLTATVPATARGFEVRTPAARVVDLGTEFGVEVGPDEATHLEVFRGAVEARATAAGAATPLRVVADEAAEVAPGAAVVAPAAPRPATFVRAAEMAARAKTAGPGKSYDGWLEYSQALRNDPSLALYYTPDDRTMIGATAGAGQSPVLRNRAASTAGRYDLSLAGPGAPGVGEGQWPGHAALDLSPAAQQRLLLPEFPLAPDHRLTAAAWVYARSRRPYASVLKNWSDSRAGQFYLGLFEGDGDPVVIMAEEGGRQVTLRAGQGSLLPTGTWVHLAFTADGSTLRLYRDGREVASAPCTGPTTRPQVRQLAIGFKSPQDETRNATAAPVGYWDGRFGELALFHRALDAGEIRRMYEVGMPDDRKN